MSGTTYTARELSHAQCTRLSQLCTNSRAHGHGVALDALVRKGLAAPVEGACWPKTHQPTEAGRVALAEARAEGW